MRKRLLKSLKRDQKIFSFITKLYPKRTLEKFSYEVKISKKKYIDMILKKFISTLVGLNNKEILKGINEIEFKYKKNINFNDKLVCIIIKNN